MRGSPPRMIAAAVVVIAAIGALVVLVHRSAAPAGGPAATASRAADLDQVLERHDMSCIEENDDPKIDFCETPLTYGGGYGRMRWFTRGTVQAFEYLAEGTDSGDQAAHNERIRALGSIGLSEDDTESVIDALPRTKASGQELLELGWGTVWLRYLDPPGRYEISGRAAGTDRVDFVGKSFQAEESEVTAILRRHRYECEPTRGDGLYCTDDDQHTVDLQRLSGAQRFNYVGMSAEATDLRADLLPALLGVDADQVQRLIDQHGSAEYYRGATAGYRIGIAYESVTVDSVRW